MTPTSSHHHLSRSDKKKRSAYVWISALTAVSMLLQWFMIYAGYFPVENNIPGSVFYLMSFQLSDAAMISALFAHAFFLNKDLMKAHFFGTAAGGGLLFFGLYAAMYDFYTEQWFLFSGIDLYGRFVTLFNLVYGITLLRFSYHSLNLGRA